MEVLTLTLLIGVLVIQALLLFSVLFGMREDKKRNKTIDDWFKHASVEEINQKFGTTNRRVMYVGHPKNRKPYELYELKYVPIETSNDEPSPIEK